MSPSRISAPQPRSLSRRSRRFPAPEEIIKDVPGLDDIEGWALDRPTSASVRRAAPPATSTSGTSITSTASPTCRECLDDCRLWFSADGYTSWGSGQTKTGRSQLLLRLRPARATTSARLVLQSYPTSSPATGRVPHRQLLVTALLPFSWNDLPASPVRISSAGGHHFRHPAEGRRVLLPEPHGLEGVTPGDVERMSRRAVQTEGRRRSSASTPCRRDSSPSRVLRRHWVEGNDELDSARAAPSSKSEPARDPRPRRAGALLRLRR